MSVRQGFSLLEVAIVLLIISILGFGLFYSIFNYTKQSKLEESRRIISRVKKELVGYAISKKKLPQNLSNLGNPVDVWYKPINYIFAQNSQTLDLCSNPKSSFLLLTLRKDGNVVTNDVIFFVFSTGENRIQDVNLTPTTIDVYSYGLNFDDVYEFVTFNYLKRIVCVQ